METLWPWLVVAGLGALHGLSPANGWMFAAACGASAHGSARERTGQVRRALLPIAIGHAASVVIVAGAVAQGLWMDRMLVQRLAGALLVGVAAYRWLHGIAQPAIGDLAASTYLRARTGLALWSCLMATAHGAGLMLVPALVPLCMSDTPARAITASGSLVLALAAVGVHLAAMLVTTGVIATGVCRGLAWHPRLLRFAVSRQTWTAALAVTGGLLLTIR